MQVRVKSSAYTSLNMGNVKLNSRQSNYFNAKTESVFVQNHVGIRKSLAFIGKKLQESIEKPLNIIYMADTHKSLGMMAKLKTAINTYKATPNDSIVLHAGDYSMGTDGIGLQARLLDKLGVDLATLGNHEFFGGPDRMVMALKDSKFKTVSSNLDIPENHKLSELIKNNKLVKTDIKEINGKKYGFIGLTTKSINNTNYNIYTKGVKALDPFESVKKEVEGLEKAGVDRIIVISHLGYHYDKNLALQIPGIDAIAGGHSHVVLPGLKENVNVFKSRRNEPVVLLHAGAYAEALGIGHLVFNDKGVLQVNTHKPFLRRIKEFLGHNPSASDVSKLKSSDNYVVDVKDFAKDKEISDLVDKVNSKMIKIADIGKPITAEWPRWQASELGSLTADAVKAATGADIAFIQPGCLRRGIAKGSVYADYIIHNVIPFNTPVVKVELSGKNILKALHTGARSTGTHTKPGLLQVSGLKYTVDMKRHKFARVVPNEVFVKVDGKYEPLDLKKNYIVAYDEFLLKAGDSFEPLYNAKLIEKYPNVSYSMALVKHIVQLLKNNESLHPDVSDRIVVKNKPVEYSKLDRFLHLLGIKKKSGIDKFVYKG